MLHPVLHRAGFALLAHVAILFGAGQTALAQDATTPAPAPVSLEASVSLTAGTETASPEAPAAPAAELQEGERIAAQNETDREMRARMIRIGGTPLGQTGGVHIVDAGSSGVGTFRISASTDLMFKQDFLLSDDRSTYVGSQFAVSITPVEWGEFSAAFTTRSLFNSKNGLRQTIGDSNFGLKGFHQVAPGVVVGGDLSLGLLNGVGDVGLGATVVGLRGNLALDMRDFADPIPAIARVNLAYSFDNSYKLADESEQSRFSELVAAGVAEAEGDYSEYRHLLNRADRFAYAINRVDFLKFGIGGEFPVELNSGVVLHPLLEWQIDVPVNRQKYDCLYVTETDSEEKLSGEDSCLDKEGAATWPQRLSLGARVFPWSGLSMLAAIDIGIGATRTFVREVAPEAPYKIHLGMSYAYDMKPLPEVQLVDKLVEKRVEVPVDPPRGRVRGVVLEQGAGVAVSDARIVFSGQELSPVATNPDGSFTSYAFGPGEVQMSIEAPEYESGVCSAVIGEQGGDVDARCELVAKPRKGDVALRVLDSKGEPLADVKVLLTGPVTRVWVSDGNGNVSENGLPPGEYGARVEHETHLIKVFSVAIKAREMTKQDLQLVAKPKRSKVKVRAKKIFIRGKIFFATDTADIKERSTGLLSEISDVILRNPALAKIEVQGHTDDRGTKDRNQTLSRERAEAVRNWLINAGVAADRLLAKGYGSAKAVVPNITNANRARNRRVEFVIQERIKVDE